MKKLLLPAVAAIAVLVKSKGALADVVATSTDDFDKFDPLFQRAAAKHGLPWLWIKAIAWNESTVGQYKTVKRGLEVPTDVEGSKSQDGKSWGIMQVTIPTANDMRKGTTAVDLNNPEISVELGARYLAQMYKRYSATAGILRRDRMVRAYNQGPGNEDKGKPYADEYLRRFNSNLAKLEKRHP